MPGNNDIVTAIVNDTSKIIVAGFLNGEIAHRAYSDSTITEEQWLAYEHPDRERMEGEVEVVLRHMMATIFSEFLSDVRAAKGVEHE